ncbi:MAG: PEGA domain-containing protein [Nitrospirae bacterium]|nr:PEGA domain-containing protein [Nitrospirota bacterium]
MRAMPWVAVGALCLAGCGTLAHGTRQAVPIASTPPGATVRVDGARLGSTPLTVTVARGRDHSVRLELRDHHPVEVTLRRRVGRWVWADVMTGVGLLVDWASGALYGLHPERVDVILPPENDELAGVLPRAPVPRPVAWRPR